MPYLCSSELFDTRDDVIDSLVYGFFLVVISFSRPLGGCPSSALGELNNQPCALYVELIMTRGTLN